jgi:hypothetical protein
MPRDPIRSARIEARIAPEALSVVKRAAEIQGRSVSEFVVSAAQEAASRTRKRPLFAYPPKVSAPLPKRSSIHPSRRRGSNAPSLRIAG